MSSISDVAACIARCLRAVASPLLSSGMARSAAIALSMRARARVRILAGSPSSCPRIRLPRSSVSESRHIDPSSSTSRTMSGSAMIAAILRASAVNRPAVISTPEVAATMSSSWWASSMMTTSCSGRTAPCVARCNPYKWRLTTTTSASEAARRARSVKQSSPFGHFDAPGHSRGPTLTAAHARGEGSMLSSERSPVGEVVDQRASAAISSEGGFGPPISSASCSVPSASSSRTLCKQM